MSNPEPERKVNTVCKLRRAPYNGQRGIRQQSIFRQNTAQKYQDTDPFIRCEKMDITKFLLYASRVRRLWADIAQAKVISMQIQDIQKTIRGDRARISATYIWEDCSRPQAEVYFESTAGFAEDLRPNANAFLLAGVLPAMLHGERRVYIDGQVCPELRNGLTTVMQQFQMWHGKETCHPIAIEASQGFIPGIPRTRGRAASFQSGGVDALATLRSNRLDIPLDHPASIKDCLMIYGFDLGASATSQNPEAFEYARKRLAKLGESEHFALIPVYTNAFYLDDDIASQFWFYSGITLAAVAHSFASRISTARIASSESALGEEVAGGSHPLLDPNYSSADLRIIYDGFRFSREEKVRLISQWDAGLQNLRVCWDASRTADTLNCGRCEKCLRTMTQLLVFDKLKDCRAFPFDDVSPQLLSELRVGYADPSASRQEMFEVALRSVTAGNIEYWEGMVPRLAKIGRHDLVSVIQAKAAEYEHYEQAAGSESFRQKLVSLDDRLLGGHLRRVYRKFRDRTCVTPDSG